MSPTVSGQGAVRPADRRPGNALVLVIGLVAAVAVLGLAYIEDNSVTVQCSFNLCHVSRARYLAESGVEHAICWLGITNPPGANADGYWPGASSQRVDETADYYSVSVVRDAGDQSRFQITSTGYRVGGVASSMVAQRVVAWVRVSPTPVVELPHALHVDAYSSLASNQAYIGDVHSNNSILSQATIQGNLTAVGFAVCTVQPTGAIAGFQPTVTFPGLCTGSYLNYRLDGGAFSAMVFTDRNIEDPKEFAKDDPTGAKNPQWNITATNPGGVINCTYSTNKKTKECTVGSGRYVHVHNDANFVGTILVDGDAYLHGSNIRLTAVPGFPAVVLTGNLYIKDKNVTAIINGAVIVGGALLADGKIRDSNVVINGPLRLGQGMNLADFTGGGITVNRVAERAWLYDFSSSPEQLPAGQVNVESWVYQ